MQHNENNAHAQSSELNDALEEAAYDYPDGNIVHYIFNLPGNDNAHIETLMQNNPFLAERVSDLRSFIEVNGIGNIGEYYKYTTQSADAFINAFAFAAANTDEYQYENSIARHIASQPVSLHCDVPDEVSDGIR